jgi:hypothetical protein
MVDMYEWFDRVGFTFDRAALRRDFPDVAFHDFQACAKAAGLEHTSPRRVGRLLYAAHTAARHHPKALTDQSTGLVGGCGQHVIEFVKVIH